ncbi:MAG: hypothetical protein HYY06_11005 [Deltaproteobacteria bacterium]|nr:hypothetical protein [Deltaproteobacteria bacterium]
MRRTTWGVLAALASGCYLSHAEDPGLTGPPDLAGDPVPPDRTSPCVVALRDCGAVTVRREDVEPEPEGGAWCCPYLGSLRSVMSGGECVFDTEACLPHEDIGDVRRAADVVEVGPILGTVEGVATRIETRTRHGTELALALDEGLVLSGAPCGPSSSFDCSPGGSCGPLELGRTYRVTGWAGTGDVCEANAFHLPGMLVVSWTEVRY